MQKVTVMVTTPDMGPIQDDSPGPLHIACKGSAEEQALLSCASPSCATCFGETNCQP